MRVRDATRVTAMMNTIDRSVRPSQRSAMPATATAITDPPTAMPASRGVVAIVSRRLRRARARASGVLMMVISRCAPR
jgi:hypothetical protein